MTGVVISYHLVKSEKDIVKYLLYSIHPFFSPHTSLLPNLYYKEYEIHAKNYQAAIFVAIHDRSEVRNETYGFFFNEAVLMSF